MLTVCLYFLGPFK